MNQQWHVVHAQMDVEIEFNVLVSFLVLKKRCSDEFNDENNLLITISEIQGY